MPGSASTLARQPFVTNQFLNLEIVSHICPAPMFGQQVLSVPLALSAAKAIAACSKRDARLALPQAFLPTSSTVMYTVTWVRYQSIHWVTSGNGFL